MYGEVETNGIEIIKFYSKVPLRHSPVGSEENHEKPLWLVSAPSDIWAECLWIADVE
jgi:hypothetical protein